MPAGDIAAIYCFPVQILGIDGFGNLGWNFQTLLKQMDMSSSIVRAGKVNYKGFDQSRSHRVVINGYIFFLQTREFDCVIASIDCQKVFGRAGNYWRTMPPSTKMSINQNDQYLL